MFLHVVKVAHQEEYTLRVVFNDGVTKDVDLRDELFGEVFAPLKSPDRFRQVAINPDTGTIEWPNGADLAPEFLYEIGETVAQPVQTVA